MERRIEAAYQDSPRLDSELAVSVITIKGKLYAGSGSLFKGEQAATLRESQTRLVSSTGDVSFVLMTRTDEPDILRAIGDPVFQEWMNTVARGLAMEKLSVFGNDAAPLRLALTIAPDNSAIFEFAATEFVKGGPATLSFTAPAGWFVTDAGRQAFSKTLAHEAHHLYASLDVAMRRPRRFASYMPDSIRERSFNEAVASAFAKCSIGRTFGFDSIFYSPMMPISPKGATDSDTERLGAATDIGLRYIAEADDQTLNALISLDKPDSRTDDIKVTKAFGAILLTTWWSSHFGPAYFVEFSGEQRAALDKACAPDQLKSAERFRQAILDLASDGVDAQPFPARDGPEARTDWEKLKDALAAWRAERGLPVQPTSPAPPSN